MWVGYWSITVEEILVVEKVKVGEHKTATRTSNLYRLMSRISFSKSWYYTADKVNKNTAANKN